MSDEDLGDPRQPQPGDPTEMVAQLTGVDLQLILNALGEVPSKFSRGLLDKLERQRDEQVLGVRRARSQAKKAQDAERLATAQARREKKAAKHAERAGKRNGAATAPA